MPDLGVTPLFYPARPTLSLDGREVPELREAVLSLAVEESVDGLYCCEATFGNWGSHNGKVDFLYFDRQVFDFGRGFSVKMGLGQTASTIFEGRITALEGRYPAQRPPELAVLAEDRLQDLRMTRRSRSFEDVNDQEVIEQVAAGYGLATEIDVNGPRYSVLTQVNQSDLAFLRERVRAIDAELWIEENILHVQARSRRNENELDLTYGKGLQEFQVTADLALQRSRLSVSGWDIGSKESVDEEVDEQAIQSELEGGESGSELLASGIGERVERIVHLAPLSTAEAQTLAGAYFRRMARRLIQGCAVAEGDARLRVGSKIRLKGLGDLFSGRYYVTHVKHTFDGVNGFRTCFDVERSGLGGDR